MADLLVLTPSADGAAEVLPALALLSHRTRVVAPEPSAMLDALDADVLVIDARADLSEARNNCRLVQVTGVQVPLLLVLREGGMSIVTAEWGADDVVLTDASPAEVEARLRLLLGRASSADPLEKAAEYKSGDLTVDVGGYTARLKGRPLDLTYKEFELLKYLMQHPGRVYTRDQLLQEVWGFDYYGGTRTVDVHVRRLRAKLGAEHEQLIGTVRNVGYRFDPLPIKHAADPSPSSANA
ncbi:MAG: response regulator transcription factor [Demequina sp.]|uniref:winged helix-turn-helix transcriptional regulator n=1 Tax=Demequina sp. TaxID=2050685 RepID=UPI0019A7038E|nr:response regulator transcription factor [Demequina sp.]MBC7298590.1 response regulator transcription factor [Demequina sp.]